MTEFTKAVQMVGELKLAGPWASLLLKPPLTRLEPQSVSGDPRHGADAEVADPLWMLGRQWQLGELLGEDVGSPVTVRVERRAQPITAWAPAGRPEDEGRAVSELDWRPWPRGAILDELIEHVPGAGAERGLRWRAEAGEQLLDMLREAGHDDAADALLADLPLVLEDDPNDPEGALDPAAGRLHAVLFGAVPDGDSARRALVAGRPRWIGAAADADGAGAVAAEWLAWASGVADAGGAWTTVRLEHRFLLRFGHGRDAVVVRATGFGSGTARWHHFEWLPNAGVRLAGDEHLPSQAPRTDVMLAAPLRYPGMPSDRYWQLEEGSVDVSAIEAQPNDLARLCLAEFALVSGDDWLVVPVDAEVGAVNVVESITVTTTFGERITVDEGGRARRLRGFRMFEVTSADGDSLPGIVLPPAAATPLVGEPVEEVAFLRDETANMAWAVERIVMGRSGDPRHRSSEAPPLRPDPPVDVDPNDLVYELQVPVPRHWIPLVPIRTGPGTIGLRKGAMLAENQPVLPAGSTLAPTPLTFPAEEIPREGITVRAVPALARRPDGTYARWTGYRIRTGRGEGHSGHASDAAWPARAPARR